MTTRKPTRAELELKIVEQEKMIEDQDSKFEQYELLHKEHSRQLKVHADNNLSQKETFDRLIKIKAEELTKAVNDLQTEVSNRKITFSHLNGKLRTIVMIMKDFYWSVPQLKKDINKIIKE